MNNNEQLLPDLVAGVYLPAGKSAGCVRNCCTEQAAQLFTGNGFFGRKQAKGFRWMPSTKDESRGRREVGSKTGGRAKFGL